MRKTYIFSFFWFILFSVGFISADQEELNTSPPNFDNVLLVIQFNHPHYGSIPFLKELYAPLFPNIVFYGKDAHPEVIQLDTLVGVYLSKVMSDALSKFPNYSGYIFLQDDCLMHVWNYARLDQNKLWFGVSRYPANKPYDPISWHPDYPKNKGHEEFVHASIDGSWMEHWGWWKTEYGLDPLRKALKKLNKTDLIQLVKNVGPNTAVSQVCDMFYIPARFRKDTIRLSNIFSNVFYEICVPMMFSCLDDIENWEFLKMYGTLPQEHFNSFRLDVDWTHPIKFSRKECRDFAKDLLQNYYNNNNIY